MTLLNYTVQALTINQLMYHFQTSKGGGETTTAYKHHYTFTNKPSLCNLEVEGMKNSTANCNNSCTSKSIATLENIYR